MSPVPDVLSKRAAGGSGSRWYSQNQTAIFAPLTAVNRPHHRARGFDQAKTLDLVRHCMLMDRIRVSPD
jgi:hypothetical protein